MDSSMISKIEKAMRYANEPDRMSFVQFKLHFSGDHGSHIVTYDEGQWTCTCGFFGARGTCSHVMTLERVLTGMVEQAQLMRTPA